MRVGKISREPLAGTVPIPWFNEALVAFDELQRRVADLPLSIELGSAEIDTVGLAGAGAGAGAGGGGGGGGGGSFLHPAANSARLILIVASAIFRLLIMELLGLLAVSAILIGPISGPQVARIRFSSTSPYSPYRLGVASLGRQSPNLRPVCPHRPYLCATGTIR